MASVLEPDDMVQIELASGAKAFAAADAPKQWDAAVDLPRAGGEPQEGGAVQPGASGFQIEEYLRTERAKDLLRFSTAGSVDDGKSTLIGRLLYDTQSIYDDQLRSIEGKGTTAPGVLDLALLTDGLRAEREQGITIDVAYRYFSTDARKFIIADTPGHEQYTRNMATGASTADAAIVLVDARKGVLAQSRRHAYIAALLGIRHLVVAVNKMDLVDYAEPVFVAIREAFSAFFEALEIPGREAIRLYYVPVSALSGDNVVHASRTMPWYTGSTLLALLEALPSSQAAAAAPFRLPVQRVVRPDLDFRGFSGQIAAGTVRPGDRVLVLPSGRSSCVDRIVTFDGDLAQASAPMSVTLTLQDEIDVSRGDLLTASASPATVTSAFTASLVWMDAQPLDLGRRYLLKHGSRTVGAQVRRLRHRVELDGLQQSETSTLAMNDIGVAEIATMLPLAVDAYAADRRTGSFVLIDAASNATAAAGMIRETAILAADREVAGPVSNAERIARFGHAGAHVDLQAPPAFAHAVERALFALGANAFFSEMRPAPSLLRAGLLVLTSSAGPARRPGLWVTIAGRETQVMADEHAHALAFAEALLQLLRADETALEGDARWTQ